MLLLENVLDFATIAHEGQRRKYTDDPYIVHPIAVADLVQRHGGSEAQVAAAMLHDVVEDTHYTLADINANFGHEISTLVEWLTDTSKPEDGNRKIRKGIDRDRLANAPAEAQFVKVADLIDNTRTIVKFDPAFARIYLSEKHDLLTAMTKIHGSSLFFVAQKQIRGLFFKNI